MGPSLLVVMLFVLPLRSPTLISDLCSNSRCEIDNRSKWCQWINRFVLLLFCYRNDPCLFCVRWHLPSFAGNEEQISCGEKHIIVQKLRNTPKVIGGFHQSGSSFVTMEKPRCLHDWQYLIHKLLLSIYLCSISRIYFNRLRIPLHDLTSSRNIVYRKTFKDHLGQEQERSMNLIV